MRAMTLWIEGEILSLMAVNRVVRVHQTQSSFIRCDPGCPPSQGAGGAITDWKGAPLVWRPSLAQGGDHTEGWPGEVCAAGDPALHRAAIDKLGWVGTPPRG